MFSLIITIIAIALVAAIALATLYYGGVIFNHGADAAAASKLLAQAQQVMGAMELYNADTGAYPATLDDLVTGHYLKAVPVALAPQSEAMGLAMAAGTPWTMPVANAPVITLSPGSVAVCEAYNKTQFGVAGVLKAPHITTTTACYGADTASLTVVFSKSALALQAAAATPAGTTAIGPVSSAALPAASSTDTTVDGWLVAPGAVVVITPPAGPVANPDYLFTPGAGDAWYVDNSYTPLDSYASLNGTVPVAGAASFLNAVANNPETIVATLDGQAITFAVGYSDGTMANLVSTNYADADISVYVSDAGNLQLLVYGARAATLAPLNFSFAIAGSEWFGLRATSDGTLAGCMLTGATYSPPDWYSGMRLSNLFNVAAATDPSTCVVTQ
jgi:hypothetical protein